MVISKKETGEGWSNLDVPSSTLFPFFMGVIRRYDGAIGIAAKKLQTTIW